MDQTIIDLSYTPQTYSSSTSKIHMDSYKYHIASFSILNISYVLVLDTAQNLWEYQGTNFHLLLYLHKGKTAVTSP